MPIRWDSVLVRGVAVELESRLTPARLRAFRMDHQARSLTLFFRSGTLVFRLHPTRGDVSLAGPLQPDEGARALQATLREVRVRHDDRRLRLGFRRVRGRRTRVDIVLELMTNQWNALVLDGETQVVRHALVSRTAGDHPLRSGLVYTAPPESDREGLRSMTLDRWRELLASPDPRERRKSLLRHVAYSSSLNAAALMAGPVEEGFRLWVELAERPVGVPCILRTEAGLQPYPHRIPVPESEPTTDLLSAFDAAAVTLEGGLQSIASLPSELADALDRARLRARRRVTQLERQLRAASDADDLRTRGDLILARLADVPQGATEVTLEGFDGSAVHVRLDPALAPADNAAAYYDRAARAERAAARVPGLLQGARRELERLDALRSEVLRGQADPEEIRSAVMPPRPRGEATREGSTLPYRSYRSSGGLEIRVGRGSKFNDDLTFHYSAPNDVWLHARHVAGAHVVLRWSEEGPPPSRDLEQAAVLAALHSKARTSATVPVDWTRRKYVRKPRKAPKGVVMVERTKTLFVEPDPAVEAALTRE